MLVLPFAHAQDSVAAGGGAGAGLADDLGDGVALGGDVAGSALEALDGLLPEVRTVMLDGDAVAGLHTPIACSAVVAIFRERHALPGHDDPELEVQYGAHSDCSALGEGPAPPLEMEIWTYLRWCPHKGPTDVIPHNPPMEDCRLIDMEEREETVEPFDTKKALSSACRLLSKNAIGKIVCKYARVFNWQMSTGAVGDPWLWNARCEECDGPGNLVANGFHFFTIPEGHDGWRITGCDLLTPKVPDAAAAGGRRTYLCTSTEESPSMDPHRDPPEVPDDPCNRPECRPCPRTTEDRCLGPDFVHAEAGLPVHAEALDDVAAGLPPPPAVNVPGTGEPIVRLAGLP